MKTIIAGGIILAGLTCVHPAPAKGWISIPAIGLIEPIEIAPIENHAYVIGDGVYWLSGTYWIDAERGRVSLAAHANGAFADIWLLRPGDTILIAAPARMVVFEVSETRLVNNGDLARELAVREQVLKLLLWTCRPGGWLVVEAVQVQ